MPTVKAEKLVKINFRAPCSIQEKVRAMADKLRTTPGKMTWTLIEEAISARESAQKN